MRVYVQRQTSTTQEYPSLIDTFFVAHTINEEFLRDEDRRIYEEMMRLEDTGTYTDDKINHLARGGKQRGHIASVGRVLPTQATASPSTPAHETGVADAGIRRRVSTTRTTRMRMAMAILSCVIYGIIAGEGIPYERSPATIPRRQVAGETHPQRQVAGESPDLSLGKALNVVMNTPGFTTPWAVYLTVVV
nr:F-box domain, leucine-rich repeat domain, L domain-like protein [Tanacetum cinerariifolium]